MFCSSCGNNVSVGEKFCRVCGKEMVVAAAPAPVLGPPSEGTVFPAQTSGKAIASLVCGLFVFVFPLSILAVIFGHLSVSEIRKNAGRLNGEGMAIAGLVLGYIGLAVIPVILIIAAITIPNVLRARISANEASAVSSLRTLNTAEVAYAGAHPNAGYTCALADLANTEFIPPELARGTKYGYAFELSGCSSDSESGAIGKYTIVARPLTWNTTGTRIFCSDESAVIKMDRTGVPESCMANGTALQ